MGRRRIHADPARPLPAGLYLHRRQYRARLAGHPFVYFGTDYVAAVAAYAAWRCEGPSTKTVTWLMDLFTGTVCPDKVKAKQLSPRTLQDYIHDAVLIKAALGHIPMAALAPHHVATSVTLERNRRRITVRNEMACLSGALTWAVESKKLALNVAKEIRRPRKKVRERLITHDEYLGVYARAVPSVKLAMVLCVRTLGLPADVLRLGPRNLIKHADGRRTLRFRRGKTNVQIEMEVVGDWPKRLRPSSIDQAPIHRLFDAKTGSHTPSMELARCSDATALEQRRVPLIHSIPTSACAIYAPKGPPTCIAPIAAASIKYRRCSGTRACGRRRSI